MKTKENLMKKHEYHQNCFLVKKRPQVVHR